MSPTTPWARYACSSTAVDQLGRARTEVVSHLHHLRLELVPGDAKKDFSAQQARALFNTVRLRSVVGTTRRWLASN
ncbi:hypothetical protein [Couchioplanes caeruleus]|uniref:Uncharacterized protein n=1 Tax=Couchioplanes caeruleus subsp. caeruleus TaxID=56427 RepID=A0A1K0FDX7_9ACTN|nr:hypothetical protein [Couchioplanes caeruleus]OJF11047.1 hypothetical protein BG844_28265 [Couchioplanes caeruleus subsp. caeruleus]